jgi:hypothetical protein
VLIRRSDNGDKILVARPHNGLSYSHQREHVEAAEGAKLSETRARRIDGAVKKILLMPARKR